MRQEAIQETIQLSENKNVAPMSLPASSSLSC